MSQPLSDPTEIKAVVREHYGNAIQSASGCCSPTSGGCCGPTSTEVALYGEATIAALPADMVTASYGCGNSLALAQLQPGETALDLGSGGGLEVLLAGRLAVSDIVFDGDLADLPVSEAELRTALSWAHCFAGALTMADYRRLLRTAGFTDISLEVPRRYTVADLRAESEGGEQLTSLPAVAVAALDGRITSCAITARRPA